MMQLIKLGFENSNRVTESCPGIKFLSMTDKNGRVEVHKIGFFLKTQKKNAM